MTEATTTPEPPRAKRANGRRDKALGPVLVSGNRLAVHFGVHRAYVETLAQQGVIERRSDQLFDQDQSRLRYIAHLRSERARSRSPRTEADAAHTAVKTEVLRMRLAQQRRELVPQSDLDALVEKIIGVTLTGLSSMPARCAPHDLVTRRAIERCVFELRRDLARIGQEMADECGEPPLSEQG